jgi:uroporphyrinogen decarboxylase
MIQKETMKSRDRIKAAVGHQPVDRTPLDLGMHYSTGISAFAYYRLRKYLGLPCESVKVHDVGQFLARVDEDVLERFHCDCVCFHPGYKSTQIWRPREDYAFEIPADMVMEEQPDGAWKEKAADGSGGSVVPTNGFFFEGWLGNIRGGVEDFNKFAVREAERIFKETDYYTMYIGGVSGFASQDLDWMVKYTESPEDLWDENKRNYEYSVNNTKNLFNTFGEYIQGICVGADLGTQIGPFFNPKLFADYCAPWLAKYCTFLHENTDYKLFYHSCGAMEPFIPMMIQAGVDILNPVQISCANMEPARLKEKYGSEICFWGGGCDTQITLGMGTPDDVAENVRTLMSKLAPDSGFVFNQVHNVMGNVPPENVVAMLDTAYQESFKYGNLK